MNGRIIAAICLTLLVGCEQLVGFEPAPETKEFRTALVEKRDIVVVVESAGVIQPLRTVEVKSKASGEILSMHAETGDFVEEGSLLVQVDKRVPRNQLALVESQREAALARRAIADAQFKRAERLFKSHSINEVDYEKTVLERANSRAGVVNSQIAIENARFALDDTEVKAPISGTVIEKLVEKGQVISSPTMDVGGGTVLMKMADLRNVQVQALVNEIDIGKIRRGQQVMVTVTSYSDQPFRGEVLKIEPQALPEHSVTAFPVLIMLENDDGLLRPGMNADVEIFIEQRHDVVAVPTAALRTMSDIEITANLIGLDEIELREKLEQRDRDPAPNALGAGQGFDDEQDPKTRTENQPADSDVDSNNAVAFSGLDNRYWVLVAVNDTIRPVYVETGVTDLDYSEVIDGLEEGTRVLLLPSSGLVRTQQHYQRRLTRMSRMVGIGRRND